MKQKGIAPIIVILLVVVVLGAAGYFAYTKGYFNQLIGKNVTPYITPASYPINTKPPGTLEPNVSPTSIPTSTDPNVRTYTSESLGISFNYKYKYSRKY